jgi:hypothetical protein
MSVNHLYKWALRVVERCVLRAAPGQPNRERKHHDTTGNMIAASSQQVLFFGVCVYYCRT